MPYDTGRVKKKSDSQQLGDQGRRSRSAVDLDVARWRGLLQQRSDQAGDVVRARALGHRLARLSAALFAEPNPTVIKGVLHAQGRIPSPAVRLPLLPASAPSIEAALSLL